MTNLEKWYKELLALKDNMAVVNRIPKSCDEVDCDKCDFWGDECTTRSYMWLWEDYWEECND